MKTKGSFKKGFDSRRKKGTTFKIRSCGNRHIHCNKCRPEISDRSGKTRAILGLSAGKNNSNWQGGKIKASLVGWNEARRIVWKRDIVCRACCKPPHKNRRLDVHHTKSRREGGDNDPKKLVGLHHSCHMKVEAKKMKVLSLKKCLETYYKTV